MNRLAEDVTQVFVVRIWHEPREIEGAHPVCRGLVMHVGSGEQRYVAGMDGLVEFIRQRLPAEGSQGQAPGRGIEGGGQEAPRRFRQRRLRGRRTG